MSSGAWDSRRLIFQSLTRAIRDEAGYTQSQLADLLNKPQSYVSKYESGERRLDVIELKCVCDACGVSLQSFAERLEKQLESGA